jgi:hypothetical protein
VLLLSVQSPPAAAALLPLPRLLTASIPRLVKVVSAVVVVMVVRGL